MPIVVRHTPVGAISRAAVMAGQARGRQLQASRDIQLTSMALAAQSQRFAIEARERERAADRAFAIQRAATAQMAKRRPVTGDALARRQQLRQATKEAEASGAYTPIQLRQMKIFADLGDPVGFRSIAGRVEQPSARRQELQRQAVAVGEIAQKNIDVVQRRIDAISTRLGKDFSPEAQQFLRENPQFATPEVQQALNQQRALGEEIVKIQQGAAAKQQALDLGISVSQQMVFGAREQIRLSRTEAAEQKRIDKQIADAEKLTAIQRADISTERRHAKEIRDDYDREIALLRREFGQYEDEDDDDYAVREQSLWNRIAEFEGKKMTSFAEEREAIQRIIGKAVGKQEIPTNFTTPDGKRYKFTGRFVDGKPWYEPVE